MGFEYSERQKENRRKANEAFHMRNPDYKKNYNKKYKTENKIKTRDYNKDYFKSDAGKNSMKKYQQSDIGRKAKRRAYNKGRLLVKNRINHAFSAGIYASLKKKKNGYKWESLVGFTLKDLINHLELQFESWMNWNNYGHPNDSKIKMWVIDHVLPISSFNFDSYDDEEFKKCWSLENLRPLDYVENAIKSDKILVS